MKLEGIDFVLPNGKIILFGLRRPFRTVVADYSRNNPTVDERREKRRRKMKW